MAEEEDEFEGIMTDADFEAAIDELRNGGDNGDMNELLKIMNENQMISWDEAERIMGDFDDTPIKSSLPPQTRPSEPDNDTNVDDVISKLLNNDPKLTAINLNNMKRTPVPQIKRIIEALRDNTYCEKLCLANMGLYDNDIGNLLEIVEINESLKSINVETNYLSGDFFAKLFQAALNSETLEEVKAVNQGVSFATVAEKDMIKAITQNTGLLKVSINLRLPEGRHKIENATIRNQDIRRELRRRQRIAEAAEAASAASAPPPPPAAVKKPEEPKKAAPKSRITPVAPTVPVVPFSATKTTPPAATTAKPEPPKPEPTVKKGPMKVYRKQSIPTTDPEGEATSSAASSKPASPIKKSAAPGKLTIAVEEKKVIEPIPAAAAPKTLRKWGKKEEPPPQPAPEVNNKPEPRGVYPRSKVPSISAKLTEEEQKRVNNAETKKAAEEEVEKKPTPKFGAKATAGIGAAKSGLAATKAAASTAKVTAAKEVAKSDTDGEAAPPSKSLKVKTDSSDAEKVPSSANEDEAAAGGVPKKKKIIKKKIIIKKIVKKKKSISTPTTATESEGDKTATESEREEPPTPSAAATAAVAATKPAREPPIVPIKPVTAVAPPPPVPKKPLGSSGYTKYKPSVTINRFGHLN